jgi:arylamine N-acetyltransferase
MNNSPVVFSDVLNRYFDVVPLSVKNAHPGPFSLVSLLKSHLTNYPFSTVHANANNKPKLDRLDLVSQLVAARAGYCFHHNVAFFEAMKSMGFKNMFYVAGTFSGGKHPTHIAIVWEKNEGDQYLVDPGAGFGISYPIPFDSLKSKDRPYQIEKNGDVYSLVATRKKEKKYGFEIKPISLDSPIFQKAIDSLTTPEHPFYNNFWYFDEREGTEGRRITNLILAVNDAGAVETKLLLIDGKKQKTANLLTSILPKINKTFRTMLMSDSFVNPHLRKAIDERCCNVEEEKNT